MTRESRARSEEPAGEARVREAVKQIILVALDASPRAADVLGAAVDLATIKGAELVLFRAISLPPEMPPEVWTTPDVTLLDFLEKRAREELDAHASKLPDALKLRHRIRIEVASPWQGICLAAEREHAQLIVIGSHGFAGLDHLLGTTAAKVVNHAHCSVLVVRNAAHEGLHAV